MKLEGLKRIVKEDFAADEQNLISKLGFLVNSAFENIFTAFNKNITITDNLNQELAELTVSVDNTGVPIKGSVLKYSLKTSCKGIICILASNQTNTNIYPDNMPFISFQQNTSNLINIKHISGLQANQTYTLRLILIGG